VGLMMHLGKLKTWTRLIEPGDLLLRHQELGLVTETHDQGRYVLAVCDHGTTTLRVRRRVWIMHDYGKGEEALIEYVTRLRFLLYPEGHEYVDIAALEVTVEWRGGRGWAVCSRGFCFDAAGHREHEPLSTGRTDEFLDRYRFTRSEAIRVAREVVVPQERARWDKQLSGRMPARMAHNTGEGT
jgi:hypothetical protein